MASRLMTSRWSSMPVFVGQCDVYMRWEQYGWRRLKKSLTLSLRPHHASRPLFNPLVRACVQGSSPRWHSAFSNYL